MKVLITGVTGQDGAYLSKLLLDKGYKVYGAARRTSNGDYWRLKTLGIQDDVELVGLELAEESNILRVIDRLEVDEIYNLAAQSFVGASFEQPVYTGRVDGLAVCSILEAIRLTGRQTRFYQASTSEMFGKVAETPQTERTPFHPRSPYGAAKLYAHWLTVNYREAYGLFGCSGILFNHESPLRGPEFLTRKTTIGLAEIRHGKRDILRLANLDAGRDWGYSGDYVEGMWRMLQAPQPDDYILATGVTRTVREFVECAARCAGFDLQWSGSGEGETGTDRKTGRVIVEIDPRFYRPAEVDSLVGDARKAEADLGWKPHTSFDDLVEKMVQADSDRIRAGHL